MHSDHKEELDIHLETGDHCGEMVATRQARAAWELESGSSAIANRSAETAFVVADRPRQLQGHGALQHGCLNNEGRAIRASEDILTAQLPQWQRFSCAPNSTAPPGCARVPKTALLLSRAVRRPEDAQDRRVWKKGAQALVVVADRKMGTSDKIVSPLPSFVRLAPVLPMSE